MSHLHLAIEPALGSPALAREHAKRYLVEHGCNRSADDALLVVSELVSNAVEHGRSPIALDLTRGEGAFHIAVSDASPWPSDRAPATRLSGRGRGLGIVERLAMCWGVAEHDHGGKTVWADVASS